MAVFTHDIETLGPIWVVHLSGRLTDPFVVKRLMEDLSEKCEGVEPLNIIIDLKSLEYLNSSGLQAMLLILKMTRANSGETWVCNVPDRIKKLLVTTKLEHIFKHIDTYQQAVESLEK
jgi:anti-anti-sigma factor